MTSDKTSERVVSEAMVKAAAAVLRTGIYQTLSGDAYEAKARDMLEAALAASPPTVPQGFVLVPREPTEAMQKASRIVIDTAAGGRITTWGANVWSAMIAAAPHASAPVAGEAEPREWRCPECSCQTYARVDEQGEDGRFHPGAAVRCVNCKHVWNYPSPAASSAEAEPVAWLALAKIGGSKMVNLSRELLIEDADLYNRRRFGGYDLVPLYLAPPEAQRQLRDLIERLRHPKFSGYNLGMGTPGPFMTDEDERQLLSDAREAADALAAAQRRIEELEGALNREREQNRMKY